MSQVQTMTNVEELSQLINEAQKLSSEFLTAKHKLMDNLRRQADLVGGGAISATPSAAPAHRQAPTAAAPAPTTEKKGRGGRKRGAVTNEKSLKQVIWDMLLEPGNEQGLTVAEIVKRIEDGKLWASSVKDISPMVQAQVYKFKNDGQLVRGDDKKYYIPEGKG